MSTTSAPLIDALRRVAGLLPASSGAGARPMRRPGKAASDAHLADAPGTLAAPPPLLRWLERASFGATPALLAELTALGADDASRWQAWIDQQLAPAAIDDSAVEARLAPAVFPTLYKSLEQLWADHHENAPDYAVRMRPVSECEHAKLTRAVYSRRQLFEVAVDFWHDHFSTFGWDYDGATVFPHYDRDVIRAHALGNFRQMLGAVTRATTMMYFLDLSANRRDGPNENFARELIELHTLGVENYAGVLRPDDPSLPVGMGNDGIGVRLKYVDEDVYSATRALTGWTLRNGHWQFPGENDGTFVFRPGWHDNYSKWFLNRFIQSYKGEIDGELALDTLAAHPGTATHVCRKLCRRFVGDEPPASLVASAAAVFGATWEAPDQLRQVLRHILLSAEFRAAWGEKVVRPFSAVARALRVLQADFTPTWDNDPAWTVSEELVSRIGSTGHRAFYWAAPNGYPDRREAWTSSGALAMTWKLMAQLTVLRISRADEAPRIADIAAQTLAALAPGQRSANAIVDYWTGRIYGFAPDPARRTVLVNFMRQNADAGANLAIDTNDWAGEGNLAAHYVQARLRHLVGLMLCAPEFHRR
ncbi:DUF1800 domain-containing protein [Dokdonella sp.]|uniref:DUF1800 domain-containing protein n=1 Tax=Dokdonella sp. TaxID=2291710 RepID=UPI0031C5C3EF|nr:DUF1800 domain-containing protein [Dokdonella sp.]